MKKVVEENHSIVPLPQDEYTSTLAIVEECILATDLALHFQNLPRLLSLAEAAPTSLQWEDEVTASVARASLMTAADLGGSTRPWPVQQV